MCDVLNYLWSFVFERQQNRLTSIRYFTRKFPNSSKSVNLGRSKLKTNNECLKSNYESEKKD